MDPVVINLDEKEFGKLKRGVEIEVDGVEVEVDGVQYLLKPKDPEKDVPSVVEDWIKAKAKAGTATPNPLSG